MTPKTCGECSLCCTLVAVESLAKPVYTPCVHLCAEGCGIHGSHPADCQAFQCGWKDFQDLGEEWKPSRSGFLIRVELDAKLLCIDVDPARPDAWREPEFYRTIKEWSQMAWAKEGQVMVYVGLRAWAVFPEEDLYLGDYIPGEDLMVGYQKTRLNRRPIARLTKLDGEVVEVTGDIYPNVT